MKRATTSTNLATTLAVFMLCVVTNSAQQARAMNTRAEDEAAIRKNVKQMEAGWNTGSGALFAKPFAEDADYVVINGMYFKGQAAIQKAHQQIFDTIFKDTTVSLSIKQIRFLRSDVAVVHFTGHREAPKQPELISDALVTTVMTKDKQGWKIAAFHNTQIVANPQR
jgi:uncharacterized protein (TIGR02246 family)